MNKVTKVIDVLFPQACMAYAEGNLHCVFRTWIDASLKPSYEHLGRVTRNKPWDEEIECDRGPEGDQVKATAAKQVTHAISPFLSFVVTMQVSFLSRRL